VNIAHDHPFYLGPSESVLGLADVVIFIDTDVPWLRRVSAPGPGAFVAQAGSDPLVSSYPIRTHRSDLTLRTGATSLIVALYEALKARPSFEMSQRIQEFSQRAEHERQRIHAVRDQERIRPEITKGYISSVLADVLDEQAIVFNEYWANPHLLRRNREGTYFYMPAAGGLGWALPAALGAKHVARDRTIVAAVGDGAYMFANPAACHHMARKYQLPILTVVANNGRWEAVERAWQVMYEPESPEARSDGRFADIAPLPEFERYAEASGGYGVRVKSKDELRESLERALKEVQNGHDAVVNVECA
jgi:acetolactate synthase-1/2/3 large subunit